MASDLPLGQVTQARSSNSGLANAALPVSVRAPGCPSLFPSPSERGGRGRGASERLPKKVSRAILFPRWLRIVIKSRIHVSSEEQLKRELEPIARSLCKSRNWELTDFLGAGATAATFEIKTADGLRALKIYAPSFLKGKRGEQVRRRFELVVEHLKAHNCPHLIQVYEGGEVKKTLYMLMQRAPGQCLAKVLKLVPPGNIRTIVHQIATAAKFLEEEKGLCHRDIKSDNIVISNDFANAVLLDLGVVRWLDEEGVGTDHEGQLPFVATAQYSSPEYMFRLSPPGLNLWRGLTFYQLGGLIHDLVMKERLFQDVVQRSSENRYLIAYAVATQIPSITHDGSVPIDLVLLAQRALEKDAARRLASVEWSDFLGGDKSRQNEVILGLRTGQVPARTATASPVPTWTRGLEEALDRRLIEEQIHCRHEATIHSHDRATLIFSWRPEINILPGQAEIEVRIDLSHQSSLIEVSGSSELRVGPLKILEHGPTPIVSISPHPGEQFPLTLVDQAREAFISLSAQLVTTYSETSPKEIEP